MADERSAVKTAWPGDIIGLFDPGIFALGDTLVSGKKPFQSQIEVHRFLKKLNEKVSEK